MVSLGNRSNIVCWWSGESGRVYSYHSFAFVRTIPATESIASVALVVKTIVAAAMPPAKGLECTPFAQRACDLGRFGIVIY